jgi:hypothetical protein
LRGFGASFSSRGDKEIVRDLKVSRNTVRKVLRSGQTSFSYEREVQPLPRLGRWRADLDRLLAGNKGKAARERLTLIRIFEELAVSDTKAATTRSGATPGAGARTGCWPRSMPSCR